MCVVACVAMITDNSFDNIKSQAVLKECELTGRMYCPLMEELRLLALHNFSTGIAIQFDPNTHLEGNNLNKTIQIEFNPSLTHAILTVTSEHYIGGLHAVVWDYEEGMVRDPDPEKDILTPLRS